MIHRVAFAVSPLDRSWDVPSIFLILYCSYCVLNCWIVRLVKPIFFSPNGSVLLSAASLLSKGSVLMMMGTWIYQLTFGVCGSKDISDTLSRSAGWCQLNLSVMGEGAAAISRGRKS